ncbi:MmgE/PrpD family protein [Halomonas maura]|uniref:MmgE/PrpD family protein n=1 Tax=Halomonas maura TaxID=117606 RepID=UPI0025B4248D|nr:MmgE/PrpD family protein [Halomonas maura]MDN3556208.1 MmgE/PrpD family protein [Halomonas maura]
MSLFAFQRDLRFSQLPAATQTTLKTCLLDILAVAAGARDTPASRSLRRYAAEHYPPGRLASRLLFDGHATHPLGAAWAGGFRVDSLDAHEGHFTSKGHAGATVVPALLALVDAYREQGRAISGEEFLGALGVGYESALRAGVALMATAPEYHASGAFSGVGVVCGGARLLGLDEVTFRHALGIAEYFGPRCPMMRLIDHPSMLRDAHGAGAFAGVNALLLAQAGVTGAPATTVESEAVAAHWSDLGERWEIDDQYFKPWPVCRWAQPALTAVSALMAEHPDLDADAVESIRVETFHESMRLQGHAPANADEAQYALAFPLAALIRRGRLGPAEVDDRATQAEDILAISRRIEIVEAEELSARFPRELLSRVRLLLKDGRERCSGITAARGDPDSPLSRDDFVNKFRRYSSSTLGETRADKIIEVVDGLDRAPDCSELLDRVLTG